MSSRSLFDLILKILGIFFIRNVLEALSRFLSVLVYLPQYETTQQGWLNLGVTLPQLLLYTLFSWLLIFRTGKIIGVLRLDRHFPQEMGELRVHRSVILGLAIIVIGGWMLANELPELFRHAVYYYQERKIYVRMARPDVSYLAMSFAKVLIGLVLVVFNRTIVKIVEVKRKTDTAWYWPARIPFVRRKKKKTV